VYMLTVQDGAGKIAMNIAGQGLGLVTLIYCRAFGASAAPALCLLALFGFVRSVQSPNFRSATRVRAGPSWMRVTRIWP